MSRWLGIVSVVILVLVVALSGGEARAASNYEHARVRPLYRLGVRPILRGDGPVRRWWRSHRFFGRRGC